MIAEVGEGTSGVAGRSAGGGAADAGVGGLGTVVPQEGVPRRDYVTLPDRTRMPIARWDFDADRWKKHLDRAGLWLTSAQEFHDARHGRRPTTLLITARKL